MKKILLLTLVCLMSCHSDIANVKIDGVVYDKETGDPLSGIELTVVCWFYGDSPDESYSGEETKKVLTNENGKYEVFFEKGAQYEIKIDSLGGAKVHQWDYIRKKNITVNIRVGD